MAREFKDSGIEWIGQIPKEWEVCLTSMLFHEHKEKNSGLKETNLLSLSYGAIIRKDINTNEGLLPQSFETYNVIKKGDIIFRLTDLQNDKRSLRTGLCKENGIITSAYVTLRANKELNSAYFHYLFHSYDICKVFYGLGDGVRQGMNWEDVRKVMIFLPSLSEQQKIADYLDKVCGEVDEMVALQETMIEELKAYKQSVITEAVTKGLNPNVPMRNSGIDWIGEIPEHWEVRRIGRLFRLRDEKNYKPMEEVQLLSLYTGIGVFPHGEQEERGNKAVTVEGYKVVHKDDIVVNIILAWMGAIGVSDYDGVTSPAYDVYIPDFTKVVPHYFHYVFRTKGIAAECYKYGRGIMMMRWRTYSSEFKQISVPYPSIEEQHKIASYLDTKCSEIDSLIALKQAKIEELKEYKKSIIYEYATGKKEVV